MSQRFRRVISSSYRSWKRFFPENWLLFTAFYALFANIPFWVACHWLGILPIGWFCIEYAAVGILALFVPRMLAATLLFLVIVADLLSALSKTYYLSPTECLANISSLYELPGHKLAAVATVTMLALFVALVAALFPDATIRKTCRSRVAVCLLAFGCLAVTTDYTAIALETGHAPSLFGMARPGDVNKFSDYKHLWISRYTVIRLLRDEIMFGVKRNAASGTKIDNSPVPSATNLAVQFFGRGTGNQRHSMPNLVLILVESWGLDSDLTVRDSLVRPYAQTDLLYRYDVAQGTVPFYGPTLAGEARELCGNKMGVEIMDATAQQLQACLPNRLASLGFHTLSVHGMDGRLFSRSIWYSLIGFQEQWFRDRFQMEGLPNCMGAFNGTCDASIAEWIGHRLGREDANPNFVYWVTLNSHLPVPIPTELPARASCSLSPLLSKESALCSWYQLEFNVHDSVAKLAMADLARPTVFVIVGDHAPPFANSLLRNQFSSAEVPYVILTPRQQAQVASQIGN
jgi:Sulfatase